MNANYPNLHYLKLLDAKPKNLQNIGLESIKRVMHAFDNPQDSCKSIHIAGTNGKGSVATTIASILGAAGHKVGLTTSPHLTEVNERLVIDGLPISPDLFNRYIGEVREKERITGCDLSFFEMIIASAFVAFYGEGVSFAVAEAGLGGEKDATNVFRKPEATVLVSVDYDHTRILGESLTEIARTKSCIAKRGVPLVTGDLSPEALQGVSIAIAELNVIVYCLGRDFYLTKTGANSWLFKGVNGTEIEFAPELRGEHQAENTAIALQVAEFLEIDERSCLSGIKGTFWPGRLEKIEGFSRSILIDCAHNPSGVRKLTDYFKSENFKDLCIGFGAMDTKDWRQMIDLLVPYIGDWNILAPQSVRGVAVGEIEDYLSGMGISSKQFGTDYDKFIVEKCNGQWGTQVVIAGSIYLVGSVRNCLVKKEKPLWTRAK